MTNHAMTAEVTAPATAWSHPAPTDGHALAARREAIHALDSFVRPMLAQKLPLPQADAPATIDLTVYDAILRRSRVGGHWDTATRRTGLVGHTVLSYAIALEFDADNRPARFVITGATRTLTEDATPESLARGLEHAALGGPLSTWAPSTVPSLSL